MTRADLILGMQWGDEGKGRVVDAYAASGYDIVARFAGGDNAGHTIVVGEQRIALHIIPSGALVEGVELFIGGGTVVGLAGLLKELDLLASLQVDTNRVRISDRAHVVLPYHPILDQLSEKARGKSAIGTTGRGIGPAYVDRVARIGITFGDLIRSERLAERMNENYRRHAELLQTIDAAPSLDEVLASTIKAAKRIAPLVVDGVDYMQQALKSGRKILIEGAQGTLLDVSYGSYPYVTSSATIAGGACTGLGIGPKAVGRVLGVAKAYCTRVGAGPFPSELHDATGERLRTQGKEIGVTTGRPRRCGWFDLVAGRYAGAINGLDAIILTKLDVLTGFERIGVVTEYRVQGRSVGYNAIDDPNLETVIEWFDGWDEPIGKIRRIADLPLQAQTYVRMLSDRLELPIIEVSVGPERSASAR